MRARTKNDVVKLHRQPQEAPKLALLREMFHSIKVPSTFTHLVILTYFQ